MRQRKVKNVEEKLDRHEDHLIKDGFIKKGRWNEVFGNQLPICLELGCGKGQFITTKAKGQQDMNFIGAEGQPTIVLRGMEKASREEITNVRFITGFIHDISDIFGEGELSGIFLNFSDPWPKKRHAKRRLTHGAYLEGYKKAARPGACLEVKTDNEALFEYTLEQVELMELEVLECTRNLHATSLSAKDTTTEYEDKFRNQGENIYFLKVKLK